MHRSFELVGPCGIGKYPLNSDAHFVGCLLFSYCGGKSPSDLLLAQREILGHVVEDLGTVVRCGLRPACSFAGGFDCVANIFPVTQRSFAQQLSLGSAHFDAVTGIGSGLLAADVELHCPIDGQVTLLLAVA